jgi:hypothetical protein
MLEATVLPKMGRRIAEFSKMENFQLSVRTSRPVCRAINQFPRWAEKERYENSKDYKFDLFFDDHDCRTAIKPDADADAGN